MALFHNPWGKGSQEQDKWFKNLWSHKSATMDDPFPTIDSWEVRTSGTYSKDNLASVVEGCRREGWPDLGVDINPTGWGNAIELRVNIKDHKEGFSYDIKRTKEFAIWQKIDDVWVKAKLSPQNEDVTSDDNEQNDEYLIPQLDKTTSLYYIYDSDRPGVGGSFYNPKAKIYSLTANFVESLEITHDANGETITDPKTQNWYHRLYIYIDNTGQGGRRLDPNKSVIAAGAGSLEQPTD